MVCRNYPAYIYRTADTFRHTVFFQGKADHHNINQTFNIGVGYRYLFPSEEWMLGVNTFYDVTKRYSHQRIGLGAEVIGTYATLRANTYNEVLIC